ncbi:ABC transporter permease [Rhizohabitans arisaemae]|uniref:ABC transporter permease n=1 Tax=Rhizohabitans arisaemae TaxID=2720610 RepID=UPI0024B17F6C|nr:ABC transporter permease subunit [Rhizohabitans arisaemae]
MRFVRPELLSAAGLIALWQLIAVALRPAWLPTVDSVAVELWELTTTGALGVVGGSLVTLLIGMVVVFVVAGVSALLLAGSEVLDEALSPLINASMATPHIALIPVFTFIWGLEETTRIVTVVAFALFPVILTWVTAIKEVPGDLVEMSSAFGASRLKRLRYVVVPSAATLLLTGVRIGVVQGIKGLVSAEIVIGVVGLGKLVTVASQTFDVVQLYAVLVVILGLSIVSYVVLTRLETRASAWNE